MNALHCGIQYSMRDLLYTPHFEQSRLSGHSMQKMCVLQCCNNSTISIGMVVERSGVVALLPASVLSPQSGLL